LPLAGVDGTLLTRLKNGPAWQRARLKTGTLHDVTALAGYVWDRHNQPWIFVGFVNSPQAVVKGRPLLDRWVQQLAGQ
jgi:D-alanyl-D-alanine carboxypeptidase/D-alanyl-D-alanine-endopeptidase (penicillin-binding protein 4)